MNEVFFTSLQILAIHILFWQGNLLFPVKRAAANFLDKTIGVKASRFVQKPLWDCLPCMASVWTILLTLSVNIPVILAVCGMNILFDFITVNPEDEQPADQ